MFDKHGETRRGKIFLLPNLFTTASLFSGFYAIVSAINGRFFEAAVAILIAAVFDGIDGRVARLTGTTSRFGMEYDSLSDLVSFGVAPATLAYLWVLQPYGRYGWLAAFLYVATTALRLARFNTQDAGASKNFTGLPCPAAAGLIATSVFFFQFTDTHNVFSDKVILGMVYGLSYLMVSTHGYLSFKHPETAKAKTFHALVAMVLLVMVVATEPQVTLFIIMSIYVLSGPLMDVYRLLVGHKAVVSKDIENKKIV